jgi:hypothetical protein
MISGPHHEDHFGRTPSTASSLRRLRKSRLGVVSPSASGRPASTKHRVDGEAIRAAMSGNKIPAPLCATRLTSVAPPTEETATSTIAENSPRSAPSRILGTTTDAPRVRLRRTAKCSAPPVGYEPTRIPYASLTQLSNVRKFDRSNAQARCNADRKHAYGPEPRVPLVTRVVYRVSLWSAKADLPHWVRRSSPHGRDGKRSTCLPCAKMKDVDGRVNRDVDYPGRVHRTCSCEP